MPRLSPRSAPAGARRRLTIGLLGLLACAAPAAHSQIAPITQHNDNLRTGANLGETALTIANVNGNQFGQMFDLRVDGSVAAQPLYAPQVTIAGGVHNVVYVATVHGSVYAFDADTGATLIGPVSLGPPALSTALFPNSPPFELGGILSTPVIDPNTGTLYAVALTAVGGVQNYFLHALSLATLQDKTTPTQIAASVFGTGAGGDGAGHVPFQAVQQNQRVALTLTGVGTAHPQIYVAFGSHSDIDPYHGWVLAYDGATLAQTGVFNDSPDGGRGGIWQGGQGLVADAAGNVYAITGNTTQSSEHSSTDYGEAFVKLATGSGLVAADYFKCVNYDALNASDGDLGSGGAVGIPGTSYLVGGGKQGTLYLVDTNNMGKLSATGTDQVRQVWQGGNGLYGAPVFWNSTTPTLYVWGVGDTLKAYPFSFATGRFTTTPSSTGTVSTVSSGVACAALTVSSNGSTAGTGIVWATAPQGDPESSSVAGTLYAFDATNLAHELWDSGQNPSRDGFGYFSKFCPPTVAGGKVYVATYSGQVAVFGLYPPPVPTGLTATGGSGQVALTWTASSGAASYNLYRGTVTGGEGAKPYKSNLTGTSYTDAGVSAGTTYYYMVTAVTAGRESKPSNEASAAPLSLAPPPVPTNLTATAGNAQVALTWTASSGATSYNLYRSTASSVETLLKTGLTGTAYTDTGLANGTTYYYKLTAVASNIESKASNEASAKPRLPIPPAPTGLRATSSFFQLTLTWNASSGATSYSLYRGKTSGGETLYASGLTTPRAVLSSRGFFGTPYFYRVTAVNASGQSAPSNEIRATQ